MSNGVTGTWSGTGSTCRAADSAATSNFNNNSSYSTYCDCSNNPEPVKTYQASASVGTLSCSGGTNIGSIPYKVTYNNQCSSSKKLTVRAYCSGHYITKDVDIPTGSSTITGNITHSYPDCACNTVRVEGSISGNC